MSRRVTAQLSGVSEESGVKEALRREAGRQRRATCDMAAPSALLLRKQLAGKSALDRGTCVRTRSKVGSERSGNHADGDRRPVKVRVVPETNPRPNCANDQKSLFCDTNTTFIRVCVI